MICGMILELFGIGLIFPALKLITDQNFLENTYRFLGIQNMELTTLLFFLTFFFIFFYGFKNFFLWIVLKRYSNFLSYYEAYLQSRLFKGYFGKSVSYFKEKNTSDIIINIVEICKTYSLYLNSLINVSLEILMQISILILLFYFNWQSTLLIFILFGGLTFFLYSHHKKRLNQLGYLRNELSQFQLRNIQDGVGGIKEIKLLGQNHIFKSVS